MNQSTSAAAAGALFGTSRIVWATRSCAEIPIFESSDSPDSLTHRLTIAWVSAVTNAKHRESPTMGL